MRVRGTREDSLKTSVCICMCVLGFGQWTVMDSKIMKLITRTACARSTREAFEKMTVHYCPLSIETPSDNLRSIHNCYNLAAKIRKKTIRLPKIPESG